MSDGQDGTNAAGATNAANATNGDAGAAGVGSSGSTQSGIQQNLGTVVQGGGSASFELPASVDNTVKQIREWNNDFQKHIPDAFREKEWVKNIINNQDKDQRSEFFNQFENAQKLIGQKAQGLQIPGEGAAPEAVREFHKSLGVPDSPDGYTIEPVKFDEAEKQYGEFLQAGRPEGFLGDIKTAAHTLGVTPKQLQGLLEAHDRAFVKHHKEFINAQITQEQEQAVDFEKLADATFGQNKNRAIENAKKLISECLPADSPWRVMLNRLGDSSAQITPNQAAIMLTGFAEGFRQKYLREDSGVRREGVNLGGNANPREAARKLMENKAFFDPTDPNHENVRRQVKELYDLDAALGRKY